MKRRRLNIYLFSEEEKAETYSYLLCLTFALLGIKAQVFSKHLPIPDYIEWRMQELIKAGEDIASNCDLAILQPEEKYIKESNVLAEDFPRLFFNPFDPTAKSGPIDFIPVCNDDTINDFLTHFYAQGNEFV